MSFQKIPGLAELAVSQMDVKILTSELEHITEAMSILTSGLKGDVDPVEGLVLATALQSLVERGQAVRSWLQMAVDAYSAQINAYRAANIQQSAN